MVECDNFFPGERPPVTVPESSVDPPDGSDPPWITIVTSEGCSTEVQVAPGCGVTRRSIYWIPSSAD